MDSVTETQPREQATPRGVYQTHREKQVRRILEAAGELFDERGISRVTMAEIIAATELTPSTLYGYFANKDELVWAMVRETMQRSGLRMQEVVAVAEGSARAKIAALMDGLGEELVRRPGDVRFMAQFDALYAREWSAERLISLEKELFPEGFEPLADLIREGIRDGSLRGDLNAEITMHAVLNAVIAVQRRLASLGKRVEVEYGRSVDALFREATAVILQGLRAPA